MNPNKNLDQNVDEFKKMTIELANAGENEKLSNENEAIILLNALPDSFKDVKAAIKYGRTSLSLEECISALKSKDLELKIENKDSGENLFVRGRQPNRNGNNNNNNHNKGKGRIGIYGTGGIGKTTLVRDVAAQAEDKKLINVVAFAEVAVKPDIKEILLEIADKLGMAFREESVSGRARILQQRLKQEEKVLLVLDNIWERLNLEDLGIPIETYSSIEISYHQLKQEELKTAFLLCCTMGHTSIENLLKYALGLGVFNDIKTVEAARNRVSSLVRQLNSSSLLLDANEERILMHDVIRDVGRSIEFRDRHIFTGTDDSIRRWEDEDTLKTFFGISLHIVSEPPKELKCPGLQFLYMQATNNALKIPDSFFTGMSKLRVLHLVGFNLTSLPTSLSVKKSSDIEYGDMQS
ncbi:hypothetical protein EZV62_007001 [Acer yangbiense]|uniref:NB-ARC domain-containing protein n=1 Tax=Acer yangbiense TaxID=1000413 RepID=A0A5C7IBE0_9ROSI|nr:hypothetical protein EZV62_007001 [Acer yangbiense]